MKRQAQKKQSYASSNNASSLSKKPLSINSIQKKCEICDQEGNLQKKEDELNEMEIMQKPTFESKKNEPNEHIQTKVENLNDFNNPSLESRLKASKGKGKSLPKAVRNEMELAFSKDFSQVNIHTNSEAVQMNKELGAKAFAHGSDIYFNNGQYNDSSSEGKKLLAHELTHTIQQDNQKINPTIIQKADTDHVSGMWENAIKLENSSGEEIEAGSTGYSRLMLDATDKLAEGHIADFSDLQLIHVTPNISIIESQIGDLASWKEFYRNRRDGDYLSNIKLEDDIYTSFIDWCNSQIRTLNEHREKEQEKFTHYNNWVPRANQFFTSGARLNAQRAMLGISDLEAMIETLEVGLEEAKDVGVHHQRTSDGGAAGLNELPIPSSNEDVTSEATNVNQKLDELSVSYRTYRARVELIKQIDTTNAEGDDERQRLNEIEQIKTVIRQMGNTVDTAMSVIGGARGSINRAGTTLSHGSAWVNAVLNKRAIAGGNFGRHNPTYVTQDSNGQLVVRNVQTDSDRNPISGQNTPMAGATIPRLPSSIGNVLEQITEWAYADEIKQLQSTLGIIHHQVRGLENAIEFQEFKNIIEDLMNKVNAYALAAHNMARFAHFRRGSYFALGVSLDNYARNHADFEESGHSPEQGNERYATVLTLVASIREMLTFGKTAKSGLFSPDEFMDWFTQMKEEREKEPPSRRIPTGHIGENEREKLFQLYDNLLRYHGVVNGTSSKFAGIEERANDLMQTLIAGNMEGEGRY